MRLIFFASLLFLSSFISAQNSNPANDPEAGELLKKASNKYEAYKNISADFRLIIAHPKLKPQDDDRKYTDTISGTVLLQQKKFKIEMKGQEITCDGINLWTYIIKDKEVQLNYFEESDDMLSPSKIFSLYKEGFLYSIREKKTVGGKATTVIEMSPSGKKLSYFKIDVTIDETSLQVLETKIYEKNGTRYIYKLTHQTPNTPIKDGTFVFDAKNYPGIKVVDLR
ncbi:MAG: outer membrane lipoprotein carrier protein LolA [Bacteroidetes bacterium]|nr:outer membrane lipoprotein carrier protein LolA [Bacteroidota bacterium]